MGEVSRAQQLRRLKAEITRKISFLEHKAVLDYREVYQLIREFFKGYLNQDYEFTITELREQMKKTYVPIAAREGIENLLIQIEEMEYANTQYSRESLEKTLKDFRTLVENLVKVMTRKKTFWEKIKEFVFKEEEEVIIISDLPVIEDESAASTHIRILLERLYLFLSKKKLTAAKKQYLELLEYYDDAPQEVREEFYPLLNEAYSKLTK